MRTLIHPGPITRVHVKLTTVSSKPAELWPSTLGAKLAMGLGGIDKPEQKRQQGSGGIGWLRSPDGDKVIRIEGANESLHAK